MPKYVIDVYQLHHRCWLISGETMAQAIANFQNNAPLESLDSDTDDEYLEVAMEYGLPLPQLDECVLAELQALGQLSKDELNGGYLAGIRSVSLE